MSNMVEQRVRTTTSTSKDLDWENLRRQLVARNELQKLLDSCQRCFFDRQTRQHRELALITGPSGVGKTSLALALKEKVTQDDCFMISGKFDLLENNLQTATTQVYRAFIEAFTQYVDLLVDAGERALLDVRQALELGMDAAENQVMQEMIPALDQIFAPKLPSTTNTTSTLKGADAEDRLIQIVTRFFRIICAQGRPIILFFDDLQWAHRNALSLLTSLVVTIDEASTSPFLLLCTCRMNEVSEVHQLTNTLRDIRDHGIPVTEIQVSNMTLEEVNHIVSGALHSSLVDSEPLSNALFQGTEGNLLFLVELVKKLRDDQVIVNKDGQWTWDMDRVLAAVGIGSITGLIKEKFYRLDSDAQELLRIASCLGSTFSVTVLSYTGVADANEIVPILQTQERQGFIYLDYKTSTCRFVHDKVQQTIYQLTPENILAELHLNIGRKLKQTMPRELVSDNVLLIAQQISLGIHLIHDSTEMQEMAELFLEAGRKAALSSAFVTAAAFTNLAIRLLNRRHWREQYKLSLQLYNFAAELEYYNGNLQRVDELVDAIIKHVRSFNDSLVSRFTRIYSLGTRDSLQEGFGECLDVLNLLGEKMPRNPGVVQIIFGLIKCKRLLRGKSDDYILSLPVMKDKKKETAMRLMIFSIVFAFHLSEKHVPLIVFRLVENTMRYGMSGPACIGFAALGMLSAYQGNIDEACRYCTLALKIFEKDDSREWHARVVFLVYGMVFPLKYPFRDSLLPLMAAYRSSLVFGDIHFSMHCRANHVIISYFCGSPLPRVVIEAQQNRLLCIKYGQNSVEPLASITAQLFLNLMGQSSNPLVLTGATCNEDELLAASKTNNPVTYVYLHFVKLQAAVFMNDMAAAKVVANQLERLDKKKLMPYMIGMVHFFVGLTYATSTARGDIRNAKRQLEKLKSFAKHVPCNYSNKVYLIEAELAAQAGKLDDAMTNFTLAIQLSRQEGMIQDKALACERAAHAAHKWQRLSEAREYLTNARSLYLEWGAQAKVDQLSDILRPLEPSP